MPILRGVGVPEPQRASGSASAHTGPPARRVFGRVVVEIPTRRSAAWHLIKPLLGVAALLAVVAIAAYVSLVATLVVFPVVDSSRLVVVRAAYPTGAIPSGAIVAVAKDAVRDRSAWTQVSDAFGVEGVSVVRVLRGPYGVAASTPVPLDSQYEAQCVAGAGCVPGEVLIVDEDHILGAVRSVISGPDMPTDVSMS